MDGQLESGGDGFDSGRQSNTSHRAMSRMTGSRPGSVLDGRPGSSMRRGRRDIERRERTRKMGNTEVHTLRNTHYTSTCYTAALFPGLPSQVLEKNKEGLKTRLSSRYYTVVILQSCVF